MSLQGSASFLVVPLVAMATIASAQVVREQSLADLQRTFPYRAAPPTASPRIAGLRQEIERGNRMAVSQFWAEIEKSGTPLVEPISGDERHSLVTFLWRAEIETHNAAVVGAINGAEPAKNQMLHLADSDVWYISYEIRNDARFAYAFSPNDSLLSLLDPARAPLIPTAFKRDPLNPRRFPDLYSSWVELPSAPPESWATAVPGSSTSELHETKFTSALLKNDRPVWVYTPPGFNPDATRYPLLVLFDGGAYTLASAPAQAILDDQIAKGRIPPVVAILVGNPDRARELMCSVNFSDFVAKELVPWARQKYRATTEATQTVVAGSSLGGLAASFAGFTHPEVFGNVLSMSGSYWWTPGDDLEPEWLVRQFASSPNRSLRMFVAVGSMEEPALQLVTNRHFRDVLTAKGYPLQYREFNGGHSYLSWRDVLGEGLVALLGNGRR